MTISKECLERKREQVLQSRAVYQTQIAACEGALKVLDDLLCQIPAADEEKDTSKQSPTL